MDIAIVVIRIPALAISGLYGSADSDNNAFLKSITIFEGLFFSVASHNTFYGDILFYATPQGLTQD